MGTLPKRFTILAIVTSAAILFVLLWILLPRREPVYKGKPLSAWAQQYGSNNWTANRAAADEAQLAIQQIGTNGIPFLLVKLRASDTAIKKKLRRHLPQRWHDTLRLKDESGKIRRIGAHGLAALGTNAPAAVPTLIDIAKHHPDEDGRYIAVFALRTLGPAAEAAIPFYIQCLTNQESIIRNEAAVGLASIPRHWQATVPYLVGYVESCIRSSDPNASWEISHAVQLLGRMGTNAKPAVPVLLTLLNHPDPRVREDVTNRLPMIDAAAAAKVGLKFDD